MNKIVRWLFFWFTLIRIFKVDIVFMLSRFLLSFASTFGNICNPIVFYINYNQKCKKNSPVILNSYIIENIFKVNSKEYEIKYCVSFLLMYISGVLIDITLKILKLNETFVVLKLLEIKLTSSRDKWVIILF